MRVGSTTGSGRIWAQMTGGFDIRWAIDDDVWIPDVLSRTDIAFTHPVYGLVTVPGVVLSSAGRGFLTGAEIGVVEGVNEVFVHWLNVPPILFGEQLQDSGRSWSGRWVSAAAGWSMRMDPPYELSATFDAAKDRPFHLMTHVGRLRREDGATFTFEQASEALSAWQTALSFAAGRWVAPSLAVGFRDGVRVCEQWRPWRCFHPAAPQAWWSPQRSEDLTEFAQLFVEAWFDPASHDRVRHYAMHVIEGNTVGTLEARVMLLGAALEYLSWVRHVIDGGRTSKQHKDLAAADKLRELLVEANVPPEEPAELAALAQLISEKSGEQHPLEDGPAAITWVRNRLVHPKDAAEPYRIEQLLLDIWSLQLQYADLLLLHEVGYASQFRKRFPPGRWAGDTFPVPWSHIEESPDST